jgi:hypothetical protein
MQVFFGDAMNGSQMVTTIEIDRLELAIERKMILERGDG